MTQNNPSAFPILDERDADGCGIREGSPGMTLRDYFAGQALPAALDMPHLNGWEVVHREDEGFVTLAAAHAYRVADAMLRARQSNDMEVETSRG